MRKVFAGALSIILFICCSGSGFGIQKKRRAARRTRPPAEIKKPDMVDTQLPTPPALDVKPANNEEARIISFLETINSFTAELVKTVNEATDKASGVDEAQKLLTERSAELKAKFADITCIPQTKVSEAVKKLVSEHFFYDGYTIGKLYAHGSTTIVKAKIQKLTSDYLELFKTEGECPKQSLAAL